MSKALLRSLICFICIAAILSGCQAGKSPDTVPNEVPIQETEPSIPTDVVKEEPPAPAGYEFEENADGTLTLTAYKEAESTLRIPSEISGKKVSAIGGSCFAGLVCLERVYIPEGVERICDYAFECCSNLKKVYMPDSLKSIGDGAFSGCGRLFLADMPEGLETIGRGAFLYCDSLVQLELPETLTELGEFAFAGCEALFSVRFAGERLTALPDRVFYGCVSLSRLFLPHSVTSVGKRAFSGCKNLTKLYFASELASLGAYAFEGCSALASIDMNAEVIPEGLFYGCYSLSWFSVSDGAKRIEKGAFGSSSIEGLGISASVTEIEPGAFYTMHGSVSLDEGNANYTVIDGSLYTADGKTLLAFFPADPYSEERQTEFTVPDGVEVIAAYALGESGLSSVTLPLSLQSVEAYAFSGMSEDSVAIPDGVNIDPNAFSVTWSEGSEGSAGDSGEDASAPDVIGSVAGDRDLFRDEDYAGFREIGNDDFDGWCDSYLAYNKEQGLELNLDTIPYIMRYKGEVIPHFIPMTAVQNRDPNMWAEAVSFFGDDFEEMYLMMNHGLTTELSRGKMPDDLILYSGLYDSQLMAAAGTDVRPTQQQLVDSIGSVFSDPIMISTTTDPAVAANFGDTLFIIYASREAMESLGAVCIDAVARSSEKEILMNPNAHYRILDVGNMEIEFQDPWDDGPTVLYRSYVKVELIAE